LRILFLVYCIIEDLIFGLYLIASIPADMNKINPTNPVPGKFM